MGIEPMPYLKNHAKGEVLHILNVSVTRSVTSRIVPKKSE